MLAIPTPADLVCIISLASVMPDKATQVANHQAAEPSAPRSSADRRRDTKKPLPPSLQQLRRLARDAKHRARQPRPSRDELVTEIDGISKTTSCKPHLQRPGQASGKPSGATGDASRPPSLIIDLTATSDVQTACAPQPANAAHAQRAHHPVHAGPSAAGGISRV